MIRYINKTRNIGAKKNTEPEYYKYINNWLVSKGFDFQRIEGVRAFPDYIVWSIYRVSCMEVKLYKGKKSLKDVNIETELLWQCGQLGILKRLRDKNKENYFLMVLNKKGEFIIL